MWKRVGRVNEESSALWFCYWRRRANGKGFPWPRSFPFNSCTLEATFIMNEFKFFSFFFLAFSVISIVCSADWTWCFNTTPVINWEAKKWNFNNWKKQKDFHRRRLAVNPANRLPLYICSSPQHRFRRSSVSRFVIYFLVYDFFS